MTTAYRATRYTVTADHIVSVRDPSTGVDVIYEPTHALPQRGAVATVRYGNRELTGIVRSSNRREGTVRVDV